MLLTEVRLSNFSTLEVTKMNIEIENMPTFADYATALVRSIDHEQKIITAVDKLRKAQEGRKKEIVALLPSYGKWTAAQLPSSPKDKRSIPIGAFSVSHKSTTALRRTSSFAIENLIV